MSFILGKDHYNGCFDNFDNEFSHKYEKKLKKIEKNPMDMFLYL
jgi:hypothetical protein